MGPTKRFEKWLSDPLKGAKAINYLQEQECEICGAEPLADWIEFSCPVAHPEYEEWGRGYLRYSYNVCLDCVEAGVASFPDRLRRHAQILEERARQLRKLADAWWRTSGRHEVCAQEFQQKAKVCAQEGAVDEDEIPF
jgi:hypothetical protein